MSYVPILRFQALKFSIHKPKAAATLLNTGKNGDLMLRQQTQQQHVHAIFQVIII